MARTRISANLAHAPTLALSLARSRGQHLPQCDCRRRPLKTRPSRAKAKPDCTLQGSPRARLRAQRPLPEQPSPPTRRRGRDLVDDLWQSTRSNRHTTELPPSTVEYPVPLRELSQVPLSPDSRGGPTRGGRHSRGLSALLRRAVLLLPLTAKQPHAAALCTWTPPTCSGR